MYEVRINGIIWPHFSPSIHEDNHSLGVSKNLHGNQSTKSSVIQYIITRQLTVKAIDCDKSH